jgi:hypothetical protein
MSRDDTLMYAAAATDLAGAKAGSVGTGSMPTEMRSMTG